MSLAEQNIEERPHGKVTCRERTERRSARLIFIFGVADDFDELPRFFHSRELLAKDGREILRKYIKRMTGVMPFRRLNRDAILPGVLSAVVPITVSSWSFVPIAGPGGNGRSRCRRSLAWLRCAASIRCGRGAPRFCFDEDNTRQSIAPAETTPPEGRAMIHPALCTAQQHKPYGLESAVRRVEPHTAADDHKGRHAGLPMASRSCRCNRHLAVHRPSFGRSRTFLILERGLSRPQTLRTCSGTPSAPARAP